MPEPVIVTGIGIISPIGLNKESFWNSLSEGKPGLKAVSGFNAPGLKPHPDAQINDFSSRDYLGAKAKHLPRLAALAVAASSLALKDAGLTVGAENSHRIGVVLGNIYCGWESTAKLYEQMREDELKRVSPSLFPSTVPNFPAGEIAIELRVKGLNTSLISGFASGTDAIGYALNYLRRGQAGALISGGAEELTPWLLSSFEKTAWPAYAGAGRKQRRRPINKGRTMLGEGAAMLILETKESACLRGRRGYAQILGYASTFDARKDGSGLARAIRLALEEAGIEAQAVDYINNEGGGIDLNGNLEAGVLKKIFGQSMRRILLSSTKPAIGHTLGACGAFGAASCVLAIENNLVSHRPKHKTAGAGSGLGGLNLLRHKEKINTALSLSWDPEGNNACLVFKKIPAG